jgi:uncharacterized protein (DUF2249 family)
MTSPVEIDPKTTSVADRRARVLEEFDNLPPEGRIVFESEEDPASLLVLFQEKRTGAFEWNVLEGGPERFRVEIVRRRTGGALRGVTECLMTDHRRLDAILADVESLVLAGRYSEAIGRLCEFCCGLNRHIEMEETVLFPMFERATGTAGGGPTEVMRQEHSAIRGFMAAAAAAIEGSDARAFTNAILGLRETLGPHNAKEEYILYPMSDAAAGDETARDDLVRRMQAVTVSG